MDVRKKLVEIVCDAMEDGCIGHCNHPPCFRVERVVNALLENGVTVQEWISVKDRLPDLELVEANANDHNWYACLVAWRFSKDRISVRKAWYDGECFDDGINGDITDNVTHWMPLPLAPKE